MVVQYGFGLPLKKNSAIMRKVLAHLMQGLDDGLVLPKATPFPEEKY